MPDIRHIRQIEAAGWNTWDVQHVNAMVHLPSAQRVRIGLHDPARGAHRTTFTWRDGVHRLGPHAADGSYCQIDLRWDAALVRLEFATDGDRLACRVSPLAAADHLHVTVEPGTAWDAASADPDALRLLVAQPIAKPTADSAPLVATLSAPVVISAAFDEPLPLPDAAALLDRQRDQYMQARLRSDGWLDDAADALTRVIHWNTIWEPGKGRICTPVSRDWCRPDHGNNMFGGYVLFCWDTFFCALMAQLEDPALARANVRAILQEITPDGFVPNFGSEHGASLDRSQPPVGAYCALKMYHGSALKDENRDRALLAEVFAPLLRWHEWWLPHRDGNGDGLLEWGSDPLPDDVRSWLAHDKQAAMYESGLDNSPMYDDTAFNPQTHTLELADVGLNALYALDARALSFMADILDDHARAAALDDEFNTMRQRIDTALWNEDAGIHQNRHWDGRFSPRLSPTLFYPSLLGYQDEDRRARALREHLRNPAEFWTEHVLPSTARSDPAYPDQTYWRGRVWAPMNFLVYEGISNQPEGAELARRGLLTLLGEWHAEGHVHENYNADTGDGDDIRSSDPLYTWGALLAYCALQEVAAPSMWGPWRFGSRDAEPAALRGLRVAEGVLDVTSGPDGLRVDLNGTLLFGVSVRARITLEKWSARSMTLHIDGEAGARCTVTVGHLPPGAAVRLSEAAGRLPEQALTASDDGQITFETEATHSHMQLTW